eukprot:CAMPEP_0184972162 /NCGR_PEP_ID=MMETSP1098-20130426/4212_1 /TAXON_ID=89044 /ORGANISM="Spumella elongata, Strain CCAP 955/1" /LENGTH=236 /DNA_ID=CAMNT_0027494395 /DNA_START=53 /DNA_END=763 /DNA_ORIENTATION=-
MAPKRKQADGGKGNKFFKVKKQEADSENEVEASEESNAEDEEDEVSIPEEGGDGLADMMSKILHQNIGTKVPVLAKRKTALMKDIETVHKDNADLKKLRVERRLERTKQMVVPDASTADFERQLKKLATRGVVALFNAIAKAKRDTVAAEEAAASSKKERSEAARDDTENSSIISRERALQASKMSASNKKAAAADKDGAVEGEGGSKWAALRDDYMVGQQLTVKNWDKAAESDSE